MPSEHRNLYEMFPVTLQKYAMKVLCDMGKDQYTYSECDPRNLIEDLKNTFPDGMTFPYVEVANAILAFSRPRPIINPPPEGAANYAMRILVNSGCDCFTYGGTYAPNILDDLKEGYPGGMDFPYEIVATEILAMSRPEPVKRGAWEVVWNTEDCTDGSYCDTFEQAKEAAMGIMAEWVRDEYSRWESATPTKKDLESWEEMYFSCSVEVYKYDPATDEYEEYWEPSEEDLEAVGWVENPSARKE